MRPTEKTCPARTRARLMFESGPRPAPGRGHRQRLTTRRHDHRARTRLARWDGNAGRRRTMKTSNWRSTSIPIGSIGESRGWTWLQNPAVATRMDGRTEHGGPRRRPANPGRSHGNPRRPAENEQGGASWPYHAGHRNQHGSTHVADPARLEVAQTHFTLGKHRIESAMTGCLDPWRRAVRVLGLTDEGRFRADEP